MTSLDSPSPILLELHEWGFVATTALPHFIASVLTEVRTSAPKLESISVSALVYRKADGEPPDLLCDLEVTARALGISRAAAFARPPSLAGPTIEELQQALLELSPTVLRASIFSAEMGTIFTEPTRDAEQIVSFRQLADLVRADR